MQCEFHHVWGVPVLQVFQECGVPPKAMARAHRAPAPIEEVSRLWTPAAGEEEPPTTAASNSLHEMVSWGAGRVGVLGRWVGVRCSSTCSLCVPRCGNSVNGWAGSEASGPGCRWRCVGTPAWQRTSRRRLRPAGPEPGRDGESQADGRLGRPKSGGGADPQGWAGAFGAALLAGTCCRWSGPPQPSSWTIQSWKWKPQTPTSGLGRGGCSSGQPQSG